MADVWRSQGKYWCESCRMFVSNNIVSQQRHEATPKHQSAKRAALHKIQKQSAESKKLKAQGAFLFSSIEQAAAEQYARETGQSVKAVLKQSGVATQPSQGPPPPRYSSASEEAYPAEPPPDAIDEKTGMGVWVPVAPIYTDEAAAGPPLAASDEEEIKPEEEGPRSLIRHDDPDVEADLLHDVKDTRLTARHFTVQEKVLDEPIKAETPEGTKPIAFKKKKSKRAGPEEPTDGPQRQIRQKLT